MESLTFLFIFSGAINLVLAVGFIYYAFKNAVRLKGAVAQYLMVAGALFFVVTGISSTIGLLVSGNISIVRYIAFIVGFLLILAGEIYSGRTIRKVVGNKPWLKMARTFSRSRYRSAGILVILLFTIPLWTLGITTGRLSIYGVVASFFTTLGFVLLIIGERKLYLAINVFSDAATIMNRKEINLMRDDIAARIYSDIINTLLYLSIPVVGTQIVDDTLNEWSEEHPVIFENCLAAEGNKIDARVVIKNLDRVYGKSRVSLVLKEFSALTARLLSLYGNFTSSKYAKEKLAESYETVKKQYGDTPIIFDILRMMPNGVLEMEKLRLLNRDELEVKVKERTIELANANKELQIEIEERRKAEGQLRTSLKEKEMLLKEIHHRVKNNLQIISSLLNLQAEHLKDKQTLELFKESRDRVKSMSLIHEQLYQSKDFTKIDFDEYIPKLTASLFRLYGVNSDDITLKVNTKDVFLGIDKAIPCGLIINELVSNSLKHAFPREIKGEISIDFRLDNDNKFTLIVSDNGVGFPEDLGLRNTKSLGLQLVNMLTQQLKGTIKLDRIGGAKFTITFQILKDKKGKGEKW